MGYGLFQQYFIRTYIITTKTLQRNTGRGYIGISREEKGHTTRTLYMFINRNGKMQNDNDADKDKTIKNKNYDGDSGEEDDDDERKISIERDQTDKQASKVGYP